MNFDKSAIVDQSKESIEIVKDHGVGEQVELKIEALWIVALGEEIMSLQYLKGTANVDLVSTRKAKTSTEEKQIPLLTGSNFDALCGESTPVCIIGAFRSSRAREKLESILSVVSHKSLTRQQNSVFGSRDSISYTLLDATKQSAFLNAFDIAGFKSVDKLLVAYKPWKRKFASFVGEMTTEEVERFIGSVLIGDIQFRETRKKPVL
ncbi:hypothetical protein SO802_031102 [Lithocarpus litseifolius]|uniref:Uncharacterized protein n=1 Tax=Lithocarpus litseifolius TaxID=425828 RepID=A0AAW2BJS2_9ROSI